MYGVEGSRIQEIDGEFRGLCTLGRHMHRWYYNQMVEILEIYRGIMDWIDLPEDRGGCRQL